MALKTRDSPLQHFSLENLYHSFDGLGPREKILALVAVGVLVLLLLFLPFSLASGKLRSMQREVSEAEKGYRKVLDKIGEFKEAEREILEIERSLGGRGSLTSHVEGVARDVGLAVKQLKEKPSSETDVVVIRSVDVSIVGATLRQLTDFIHAVENDPKQLMRFKRIQVKPKYSNRQLLDLSCEIATFSIKKEA